MQSPIGCWTKEYSADYPTGIFTAVGNRNADRASASRHQLERLPRLMLTGSGELRPTLPTVIIGPARRGLNLVLKKLFDIKSPGAVYAPGVGSDALSSTTAIGAPSPQSAVAGCQRTVDAKPLANIVLRARRLAAVCDD